MDVEKLSIVGSEIRVEGYPDGVKVVRIDGALALTAADLALHQEDLEFALECLQALEGHEVTLSIQQRALWHASIVHYMKCFGRNESRSSLRAADVYKTKPDALDLHRFFKNIRHKHVVHDENSHYDARPGAIINNGTKPYKVEKIVVHTQTAMTLEPESFSNLKLLVEDALIWVRDEFDAVTKLLTAQLEKEPHAELLAREQLRWEWPKSEDVSKARAR